MNEHLSSSSLSSVSVGGQGNGDSHGPDATQVNRSPGVGAGGAPVGAAVAAVAGGAITRTGKIARLPQAIRQRLNERLADGEPQHLLVAWLNEHALVRDRLEKFHGGRAITEQNLSDWKAGGFRDWERHQETRGQLREFLCEAEELGAELGEDELIERATSAVVFLLVRLSQEAMVAAAGPEQRKAVVQVARELSRIRTVNLERQRVQLLVEKAHEPSDQPQGGRVNWKELNREVAESDQEQKKEDAWLKVEAESLRAEYVTGMETQTLTPERREYIEGFFDYYQPSVEELELEPLPHYPAPRTRVKKQPAKAKKKPAPGKRGATPTPTKTTAPTAGSKVPPVAESAADQSKGVVPDRGESCPPDGGAAGAVGPE